MRARRGQLNCVHALPYTCRTHNAKSGPPFRHPPHAPIPPCSSCNHAHAHTCQAQRLLRLQSKQSRSHSRSLAPQPCRHALRLPPPTAAARLARSLPARISLSFSLATSPLAVRPLPSRRPSPLKRSCRAHLAPCQIGRPVTCTHAQMHTAPPIKPTPGNTTALRGLRGSSSPGSPDRRQHMVVTPPRGVACARKKGVMMPAQPNPTHIRSGQLSPDEMKSPDLPPGAI